LEQWIKNHFENANNCLYGAQNIDQFDLKKKDFGYVRLVSGLGTQFLTLASEIGFSAQILTSL
jgi:hypothetical protein